MTRNVIGDIQLWAAESLISGFQGVDYYKKQLGLSEFPTVCLCGSGKFENEFHLINQLLTASGYQVLMPAIFKSPSPLLVAMNKFADKEKLDELHKAKIRKSDIVVAICPGNYIGTSTRSEINYALEKRKPVIYFNYSLDAI